jgi:hypothetical protein
MPGQDSDRVFKNFFGSDFGLPGANPGLYVTRHLGISFFDSFENNFCFARVVTNFFFFLKDWFTYSESELVNKINVNGIFLNLFLFIKKI